MVIIFYVRGHVVAKQKEHWVKVVVHEHMEVTVAKMAKEEMQPSS